MLRSDRPRVMDCNLGQWIGSHLASSVTSREHFAQNLSLSGAFPSPELPTRTSQGDVICTSRSSKQPNKAHRLTQFVSPRESLGEDGSQAKGANQRRKGISAPMPKDKRCFLASLGSSGSSRPNHVFSPSVCLTSFCIRQGVHSLALPQASLFKEGTVNQ